MVLCWAVERPPLRQPVSCSPGRPFHRLPQVVLSFYEARRKQPWALGFGAQEERLFWEQWCALLYSCCIQ